MAQPQLQQQERPPSGDENKEGDGTLGLGDFAVGLLFGLKLSVPAVALGWAWRDPWAQAHAHTLAAAAVLLLAAWLAYDRFARGWSGLFAPLSVRAGGALPEGWSSAALTDGTPFWFHRDAPTDAVFERPRPPPVDGQVRLERPSSDESRPVAALADYGLSGERGCLLPPRRRGLADPGALLPPALGVLESLARDLPALLPGGGTAWHAAVGQLQWTSTDHDAAVAAVAQEGGGAVRRAQMVVAFVAQACLWAGSKQPLPQWLTVLWEALHQLASPAVPLPPPALEYAAYVLYNWQLLPGTKNSAVPALLFSASEEERSLVETLLAVEQAGGDALLAAVGLQKAAKEWDSEGVAQNLKGIRATLCDQTVLIRQHLISHRGQQRPPELLRLMLQLPGGGSLLLPSGACVVVAALLGVHVPEPGRTDLGDHTSHTKELLAATKGVAAAARAIVAATGGAPHVSGYAAAIASGPSVPGFARHCWEALEGVASGDCPFVGTREYAVLDAFDKCAVSLSDMHAAYCDLQARYSCSAAEETPGVSSGVRRVHVPFLASLPKQ